MDELDFSADPPKPVKPKAPDAPAAAQSPLYQPAVALEFFKSAGSLEVKPGGNPIFSENEKVGGLFAKGPRMYLLLDGKLGLMAGGKFIGLIKSGEIFGELALIAKLPRTATAFANTDCKVLSLDEKQFHTALEKKPEFALMLMSIMVNRLRQNLAKLGPATAPAGGPAGRRSVTGCSTRRCWPGWKMN
ncbi:MAG: cyclic nucleotide-binding domain-containing protein [Betaproteobacteria bacterium]|nr:cyclic nucleotide-binding domain-containing protein [Betaproteobacteria bacterium]